MDISSFRELADETLPILINWPTHVVDRYKVLDLPQMGSYATSHVSEELYARIRKVFNTGNTRITDQCKRLIGELIYDEILDNLPMEPYIELLATIHDATNNVQTVGGETDEEWRIAIELAHLSVNVMCLNAAAFSKRSYANFYALAYASSRLRSIGYSVERDGANLKISAETETKLLKRIEEMVALMGGLYVARHIFALIAIQYDSKFERYHFVTQKNIHEPETPLITWGFLLQLSVKHYNRGWSWVIPSDDNLSLLVAISRDYATLLEAQDYAYFPYFHYLPLKMMESVQKQAVSETLYRIPQVRGRDVPRILRGLIDDTFLDFRFEKGWTIRQAIKVIEVILSHNNYRIPTPMIFSSDVQRLCPEIDPEVVDVILGAVLSHPISGANQNLFKPTDASSVNVCEDFSQRPLLKHDEKSYTMMDRSWCAAAFIEALFIQMRDKDKTLDKEYLGKAIERFTKEALRQHNIQPCCGNYLVHKRANFIGSNEGQCDAVVETSDTIILIEVKKKSLTRKARAGSDASLLLDLTQSLLEAQVQAGNHEIRLRQDGHLDLDDNGIKHRIELNGRKVERIALSFTDYGSFHDRIFLDKFLTAVSQLSFTTNDPKYVRQFKEIADLIACLQMQAQFLYHDSENRPYFNCWFFSLPQLLILLDGVNSAEGFREALWSIKGLGTGQGDLCWDIRYAETMKETNKPFYEAMLKLADHGKTFITGF